jgi:vacuolar-type H+-ATPase subunit E/Vma4
VTASSLLDRVTHQAEEEVARRLAVAHATAEEIRVTTETERLARRREAVDQCRAQLAHDTEAACAAARFRTSGAVLEARARFLDRVFVAAEQAAGRLGPSPQLETCIDGMVGDAIAYLDPEQCRLRCAAPFRSMMEGALGRLGATQLNVVEDPTISLGAVLESDDGRVSVDATVVGQMRRRRAALAIAAVSVQPESA